MHLARHFVSEFNSSNDMLMMQLGDLEPGDVYKRARGDEGASIGWLVGHLLGFRYMALGACGVAAENPYGAQFSADGAEPDEPNPPLDELIGHWERAHRDLTAALASMSEEDFAADSQAFGPDWTQPLASVLGFCVRHEIYHLGGVGLLRVQHGYRHTHVLAMEKMMAAREAGDQPDIE